MQMLLQQYYQVKQSREVVLAWCETIAPEDYTAQVPGFGKGGTIHSLQVHTANTYLHWLEGFAQYKSPRYYEPENIHAVEQIREIFETINETVVNFLQLFNGRYFDAITNTAGGEGKKKSLQPLTLFTHVVTHEFHHKGQVMSMGRTLGYTPPDADIIQ